MLGVTCRFWINEKFAAANAGFPYHTFAINLLGSFLIGAMFAIPWDRDWLAKAIIVGFLGGFTTFSSFSWETFRLVETGALRTAALYFVLSPLLGVALAWAGYALVRR
jgi:CrcB protein